jgi:branched-chain amino acid transport system ATP-binding protein
MTLELKALSSGYGRKVIISDVSFTLEPGKIITFLGHNGAGKSTTLKTIAGLLRPAAGEIWLEGERIDALSTTARLQRGLRLLPEGRGIFPDLTVEENINVVAASVHDKPARFTKREVFDFFPILADKRSQVSGRMSGGQQQMLAFGLAILGTPRYILLEEPSVGLQPDLVEELFGRIREICVQSNVGAILVEHRVVSALKIADHVLIMNMGQLVFDGTPVKAQESSFWEFF